MNSPTRPKVLITGSEGLLGCSLMKELGRGFEISAPTQKELNILRRGPALEYINRVKPDLIIHAAAFTIVDRAEEEEKPARDLNVEGSRTVAEGARRCRSFLIYFSTDYIFDGLKDHPYTEDDSPAPLNVYGRSKLDGEKVISETVPEHLIIRTAWIYGPGRDSFVRKMIRAAADGKKVEVVGDQVGSPTYTPHLAGAVRLLHQIRATGVVNVVNSGSCSWYQLTREIYSLAGASLDLVVPISTKSLNRPARRPPYSVLSMEKFHRMTGRELPSWAEALRSYFLTKDWQ
jgi:dTDP-4-dehydrorhamnose reductase